MQTLIKFKEFFDKITAEAGRNYKISVLEEYKNDEDIKYLLNFLYNPYITTGISEGKLNKISLAGYDEPAKETLRDLLEYLKENNTGRMCDVQEANKFAAQKLFPVVVDLNVIDQDAASALIALYFNIIKKNVQLGVDSKTINKVIPGLIPEFNVQLSNKYFDKPEVVEGKEFVLTTKIDGSRIIAIKDNGKVSFYTRQGQKYEGLVDLENELLNSPEDNFVFDGEIVAIDTDLENTYKNTMKLSRTKDLEKHGLKMLVFDYMPVANWKMQKCPLDYRSRRGVLTALFDFNNFRYFQLLPKLYQGTDTSKIIEILDEQTSQGQEGIMINIVDAPYEFKRTNNLLKVKKFQDTELKIIGFEEGTNKLAGTLGAFICEYKGNTVKVGSGLSDEDRAYFWNNKIKFLGRYITVKYFEISTDSKTGLESLRFPIYMRVREDMPTIPLDVNGPRFEW